MNINVSWDKEFEELMLYLRLKYKDKMFDLDGIGDNVLDLNKFSKNFFKNQTTAADVSVDSNANVVAKTGVEYSFELAKPLRRYNSYFMLWKQLKKLFGADFANKAIEMQLAGDIYINDFVDICSPYSYHPGTTIILRKKNDSEYIIHTTMESLFKQYEIYSVKRDDYEEIDLKPFNFEIYEDQKWVSLERVLRHITDKCLYRFESKYGNVFTVTSDHPCILSDDTEKSAEDVIIGDRIKTVNLNGFKDNNLKSINIDPQKAYTVGSMIGDGSTTNCDLRFHQKNVEQSHFYNIFKNVYDKISIHDDRTFIFGNTELALWFKTNIGTRASNKKLPDNYLNWSTESKYALLSGIIDTDGTVNKRSGVIDIRLVSLGAIQQIAELATNLNFTRVRTSLAANYQKGDVIIKQLQPLYRVSFSIPNECNIFNYSKKLQDYKDIVLKKRNIDGRFESDEIIKKEKISFNNKYVYDVTTSSGKFYTNGIIAHNCFNYSTNDIAYNGLIGISKRMNVTPPKSLYTFIRQVEQFIVYASNSTLGATGIADFLIVCSYFVEKIKETGYDGHIKIHDLKTYISEELRSFIYTVNWEFRGNQSPFTNVSIFDKYFLESLVPEYYSSLTGKPSSIETVQMIQEIFIDAMNEELERSPNTFPVTTACFSVLTQEEVDNSEEWKGRSVNELKDDEFCRFIAEKNKKFGFINIYAGETSQLSSCCRLRSSNKNNEYFNSFGSGSTKIGSLGVVTVNFPRLAMHSKDKEEFLDKLVDMFDVTARINNAKRKLIEKRIQDNAAPLYTLGHMELQHQYSTMGVTGLNEAVSILGMDILSQEGIDFVLKIMEVLNKRIDIANNRFKSPHNCEQVPAESSAVKLAAKDKLLGYNCGVPLYSNQFIPLTVNTDLLNRIRLQGLFDRHFSGGAICHINVDTQIEDTQDLVDLIKYTIKSGTIYFAINYKLHMCENHHMWVGTEHCPICGKEFTDEYTRVVGFLTNTKNWNMVRREHDWPNRKFYSDIVPNEE